MANGNPKRCHLARNLIRHDLIITAYDFDQRRPGQSTTTHLPHRRARTAAFDSTPLKHVGRSRRLLWHTYAPQKTWESSIASSMTSACLPHELRALPWPPSSKSSLQSSPSPSGVAIMLLVSSLMAHRRFPLPPPRMVAAALAPPGATARMVAAVRSSNHMVRRAHRWTRLSKAYRLVPSASLVAASQHASAVGFGRRRQPSD